jgi:predicted alpha/beta hydrolase family esterase
MNAPRILLLPDWQGPSPWQAAWERQHGALCVQQHDLQRPLRGDWSARLQEVVLDTPAPLVLVAEGLGCILVAWWAAHSPLAARVQAVLLLAPSDVEQAPLAVRLPGWSPVVRRRLPFAGVLVGPEKDQALAQDWGLSWQAGAAPTQGDWPEGRALLQSLLKDG